MKAILFLFMLPVHIVAALMFLPLLIVTILFHWLLSKGIDAGNSVEITMPSLRREDELTKALRKAERKR